MKYRMLALDLDGTLTNSHKEIQPRTQRALERAAAAGVHVVLASGRPTVGIWPLARQLALEQSGGCILSYNGGKIIDCTSGATLVQTQFPPDLVSPVCQFARENGVMALTYTKDGVLTEKADDPYVQEEARINRIAVEETPDLARAVDFPIHKFLLVGDPAKMPHVEEKMQQQFSGRLSIYRSAPFFIETMPLGVEKAASLGALLQKLDLGREQLMACGDGWNDLPMIRFAGCGVAMGNAVPEVKAEADWITSDNDHDGVGVAVERFILEKRSDV
jgi:Cof subfamily protein (haloacid dehalogenase superfamily)